MTDTQKPLSERLPKAFVTDFEEIVTEIRALEAKLAEAEINYQKAYKRMRQLEADFVSRSEWDDLYESKMGLETTLKAAERERDEWKDIGRMKHGALHEMYVDVILKLKAAERERDEYKDLLFDTGRLHK